MSDNNPTILNFTIIEIQYILRSQDELKVAKQVSQVGFMWDELKMPSSISLPQSITYRSP